jgi:glutathione S-transferase
VPVLLMPGGLAIQDTADITDHIESVEKGPRALPDGGVQWLVSYLLELYAHEWLVIAPSYYRWTCNEAWIVEELGRTAAPEATREEQRRIGQVIAATFRDVAPSFGASEETNSGIEAHYEGFLADYSAHLRRMPFALGHRPSLGDFALFGPLYGPLYRDSASGEIMRSLRGDTRVRADRLLSGIGAGSLSSFELPVRLDRRDYRLVTA